MVLLWGVLGERLSVFSSALLGLPFLHPQLEDMILTHNLGHLDIQTPEWKVQLTIWITQLPKMCPQQF